jgi:hypothetical protein
VLGHGIFDRAEWPDDVLAAVAAFRQGDLVRSLPLFYWGDPGRAAHSRTRAYATAGHIDAQVIQFNEHAPFGLVTTQTCDLALEGGGRPKSAWVQLAPVFDATAPHPTKPGENALRGDLRKLIAQGRSQDYLHIPNLPDDGFWVADLTIEVPVERGWLAAQERLDGFGDEAKREAVGKRLAWLRNRPAFDSRFVDAVQKPMMAALQALRKDDRPMFERMGDQVPEMGVVVNGRLAVAQAELAVLHAGLDADLTTWWQDRWVELKQNADTAGFNLLPLRLDDIRTLPTVEYQKLTRLPLANLSENPAWYGEDPEGFPD